MKHDEPTVNLSAALSAARTARFYRDALAELLATLVDTEALSESQMAEITRLNLVTVRQLIDSANIGGPRRERGEDLLDARERFRGTEEKLVELFRDGIEHGTRDVVRARARRPCHGGVPHPPQVCRRDPRRTGPVDQGDRWRMSW